MFQEILFGQTRNPSKIFPNIFINIGDMGAEIIWRPLTARRRFMTKIFPHPLLYTLTLHWIHPLYTSIHDYSSLRWHSNVQKYEMWMQSVDVCIDLYNMQNMDVHCWRVRSNVRHAKCERTYFHKVRERRYAPALLGGEEDCRVYNTSYFQGPLLKSVHCYVFTTDHISKAPATLHWIEADDVVLVQLFRPKFCWSSLRGKFCMDKNPAQTFPGQFHKMSHKICDPICKSRHI